MDEQGGATAEPPTHGCMECKAQRPCTIKDFANGNTGWRCAVCGKILRLIPGKYRGPEGLEAAAVPA
jgi:hypothetical protein